MSYEVGTVVSPAKPAGDDAVTILSERESWELLGSVALGRLVTTVDNEAHIFPVNFAVQGRTILFRTAEGTKLISAAINHQVLFEADEHNVAEGWSVIVRGVAHTLRTDDELDAAERAQLLPWTATAKTHWVRVTPTRITGRRFRFGPEPGAV
ncbi:pyridoxamine 5'-phosphate oxidase family protein [Mycolicibacterium wolinskyi]|uniref:Pyridoxamine 5'-phosphate oxidase n=1 Tax=Mycolicibacterium wolinskyi TaxID=59750 RepID=A0A1X2FD70_9MYCO|nr:MULTISPECIES: pyridoxamine 5'-phosphate oxidase family protein [Mycolicibacterium]MCV7289313.1 pyridoxamine 5'-phosphate oxidase family protein [Mycolicibacterium wolinskyi]MCV7294340.1 pyridoxamine 5'-phosphate oxidase family protein [Mycolicibacterium goodii]ORX16386.1 pyridoxamine 5'-phosphate oxidase [Mycolicibacterium wolinskyi]